MLEEADTKEEADERESYWIHFYIGLKMPLVNASIPPLSQGVVMEKRLKAIAANEAARREAEANRRPLDERIIAFLEAHKDEETQK